MRSQKDVIIDFISVSLAAIFLLALASFLIMIFWNASIPYIFNGVNEITFVQSGALYALLLIIRYAFTSYSTPKNR